MATKTQFSSFKVVLIVGVFFTAVYIDEISCKLSILFFIFISNKLLLTTLLYHHPLYIMAS